MSVLKSAINPRSDEFRANAEATGRVIDDMRKVVADIKQGGGKVASRRGQLER